MRGEIFLTAVKRFDCASGTGRARVLRGALTWAPLIHQATLRGFQTCFEPSVLSLFFLIGLFPADQLARAALAVSFIAIAVDSYAAIRSGVHVHDCLGEVRQQCSIVADHSHTTGTIRNLRREKLQSTAIQVVGRFIKKQEVIIGTQ